MTRHDRERTFGIRLAAGDAVDTWGWSTPAGRRRAARRATLISDAARLGAGVRALEIGCGTGLFTAAFAETDCDLTAIDLSPDLIALAKQRQLPVTYVIGALETADLPPSSFDAIVGSSVVHHLDVDVALARMRTLLRPGGRIAFAEPNYLNPHVWFILTARRWFPHVVSPDETAFLRWAIAARLERAGFCRVRVRPFDWLHPATPAPAIGIVTRIGQVLERMPIVRECAGSLLIQADR